MSNNNSSSSSNASQLSSPFCFSDPDKYPSAITCFAFPVSYAIFFSFMLTTVLLLPLHVFVLWRASRRWNRQRSTNSGATSHSDVFTCNMVVLELINTAGSTLTCSSTHSCSRALVMIGFYVLFFTYPAQSFFHCLTCVERYLAVVHPVTYRGLKGAAGAMVRNISIGCTWLLSAAIMALACVYYPVYPVVELFSSQAVVVSIVSFCSLAVLRAINGLGFGKVGGRKEQIDPAKKRAFYTIATITGTLILRFLGLGVSNVIFSMVEGKAESECVVLMSVSWLCLPSGLAQTLLFLHTAAKLPCVEKIREKQTTSQ